MERPCFELTISGSSLEVAFSFSSPLDLAQVARVSRFWYRSSGKTHLWRVHVQRAKSLDAWSVAEERIQHLRDKVGDVHPKALYAAMLEHAQDLRVADWADDPQAATRRLHADLTPVRRLRFQRAGGILTDIEFISQRHKFGYAAFVAPMIAPLWGARGVVIGILAGCALRYVTYDVYYDSQKKLRKGPEQRWRAVRSCLKWHIQWLACMYLLKLLGQWLLKRLLEDNSSSSSSPDAAVYRSSEVDDDDDDRDWGAVFRFAVEVFAWGLEIGGATFLNIDGLPLPSAWR